MAASVRLAPLQVDLLNLVRAAAAQLVLVGHATHYYLGGEFDAHGRIETMGVLVFFVLSGFLISSSVLQKWDRPDYRFEHYLIDRFCRIFVAYGPALVLVAAADATMRAHPAFPYPADESLGTWLGNLAMLQDYPVFQVLRRLGVPEQPWFIRPFGSGRPFWTVAIEWWIYLFFGYLALVALRRRRITLRSLVVLAVLGVVPAYNAMGGVGDCLTLVWVLGALFALLQNRLARRADEHGKGNVVALSMLGIALCACLLLGRIVATGFRVYDLQFAMFVSGILFGLFFLAGAVGASLPTAFRRAIDFLADYSYSLYLIHFTVLMMFVVHLASPAANLVTFLAVVVAANLASVIFWFGFERHYRAIADAAKSALDRRRVGSAALQPVLVRPRATKLTSGASQNPVDSAREGS